MKEKAAIVDRSAKKNSLNNYLNRFEGRPYYYGNASHAFYDIMVWLQKNRPKDRPNIVMPVYIPAKLYRFILAAGYEPKFYDLSTELDFDLEEISALIDDQTQAVFATHFFGVPVDLLPLKNITQDADVFLIEDCAHSLNALYKGRALGSTGDCTLFSTRKMMQLHCGGILVLKTELWDFEPSQSEKVRSAFTIYHYTGSRVKHIVNSLLGEKSPFKQTKILYDGYINHSEEHVVKVKEMDHFFRWYINIQDLDKVADKRRKNFQYLLNGIKDLESFYPMGMERYAKKEADGGYSLTKGFVPFSMPVLVPAGHRDEVQQALSDAGVLCFIGWPEAPFGLKGFRGADKLKDRILELPVHQFVGSRQLSAMVDCLNSMPKYSSQLHAEPLLTT